MFVLLCEQNVFEYYTHVHSIVLFTTINSSVLVLQTCLVQFAAVLG